MGKYNLFIITKDMETFNIKKKKLLKYTAKINLIKWIPAEYIALTNENNHVINDLQTRYNTSEKRILGNLGNIAAHRKALLSIWNNKTNNNIILEQDFKFTHSLPEPPSKTCYLGGWIIPKKISDAGKIKVDLHLKRGLNKINYDKFGVIMTHAIFYKTFGDAFKIFKKSFKKTKNWDIFLKNEQFISYFYYPEIFIQNNESASEITHKKNKNDKYSINYGLPNILQGGGTIKKRTKRRKSDLRKRPRTLTSHRLSNKLNIFNLLTR